MYTIGQLAEMTGFSRDTLNWYIRTGLITYASRIGHYRLFDDSTLERLERIKTLRAPSSDYPQGMPLEQIHEHLESAEDTAHGVL